MQNQGEDQPCRIKLEGLPTKHQVPKQGAREFLRLKLRLRQLVSLFCKIAFSGLTHDPHLALSSGAASL